MNELTDIFAEAYHVYEDNEIDLSAATYFMLRPILDGDLYTHTTEIVGRYTNRIQIRMGTLGRPSTLAAIYDAQDLKSAVAAFFSLERYGVPLWYNGSELQSKVVSANDMLEKILLKNGHCKAELAPGTDLFAAVRFGENYLFDMAD